MSAQMTAVVDDPLSDEYMDEPIPRAESPTRERVEGVLRSVRGFATVSEALRIVGALVMLASLSVFLLQGWNDGNDISRYLLLLGQTGLLTAAGFALSFGLKENRGARMFFGLALISVCANFTILGALLYSVVQWDGSLVAYPDYASWQLVGVTGAGVTLAGALLALIPITLLGFAIMARRSYKPLALHFLLLNALLLLPVRGSTAVGALALAATLYALYYVRRLLLRDTTLKTPEGRFAMTTMFIPIVILVFRSMYFYAVDALLVAMLSFLVFAVLRQASLTPDRDRHVGVILDVASMFVALTAAVSLTGAIEPLLGEAWLAPVFAVTFAALCIDVGRRASTAAVATAAYGFATLMLGLCFAFNVASYPGALTAVSCVLLGMAIVVVGHGLRDGVLLFVGYGTTIAGAVFGLGEFAEMIARAGWVELAVFGAGTIAVGSVLDRHGVALRLRAGRWFSGLRQNAG